MEKGLQKKKLNPKPKTDEPESSVCCSRDGRMGRDEWGDGDRPRGWVVKFVVWGSLFRGVFKFIVQGFWFFIGFRG